MKLVLSVVVFVFVAAYVTANEPDYANGNFAVPSVPKREILRCMGNFCTLLCNDPYFQK